jgi:hypothetical protein
VKLIRLPAHQLYFRVAQKSFASPAHKGAVVANVLHGQDFSINLIYIKPSPVTCPTEAATDYG